MDTQETPISPAPHRGNRSGVVLPALLGCIFLCACVAVILPCGSLLLVTQVLQNFEVVGASMEPVFYEGDLLLVNKLWRQPDRFDAVVLRYPKDESKIILSRVVGLPGDRVEIRGGQLYVNGEAVDEPFIAERPRYRYGPETVPKGQYFVLGDNRNHSSDSHVWGFVPAKNIVGTAWLRYWSAEKFAEETSEATPIVPSGARPRTN